MSKKPFQKFIQQKETGAQKKERIRQEKKKVRKETQEYFDQKKAEIKQRKAQARGEWQARNGKPEAGSRKPAAGAKKYEGRDRKPEARNTKYETGRQQPAARSSRSPVEGRKYEAGKKPGGKREAIREHKSGYSKTAKPTYEVRNTKPAAGHTKYEASSKKPETRKPSTNSRPPIVQKPKADIKKTADAATPVESGHKGNAIPLNKFIAHAGITSRRDAADLVRTGIVAVNGKVVTDPGSKVSSKDEVKVNGKQIAIRKNLVYILLNKPKDFITTTEDPQGRKTVLDLIKHATTERVYPIGRLDRNTTGVLLFTNDGELAQKLSHPSYQVKKIYEVKLDKPLAKKDFDAILAGITLEDGFVAPDVLAYADPKDKSVIGIEIHSGRNRIVRRIFEHLGYDVRNLDRVMYANLTKKNVERGKWRFLNEKEVRLLKFLNASYTNKNKTAHRD